VIWVRTHKAFTRISNINKAFSKTAFDKADLIFENYLNLMYNIEEPGTTPHMFLIDQKKNFWFGTWNNGLYNMNMVDSKKIIFEELYERIPELQRNQYDNTGTIMEDRTGLLWVVFFNKGIMKLRTENNLFTSMSGKLEHNNMLSKEFWQLYEDDDGNLWIGSWLNGLFKIGPDGKVSNYKIIDPNMRDPMENHITSLLEVEKGSSGLVVTESGN
jgi:ligand-binding sensor domain-containing protein